MRRKATRLKKPYPPVAEIIDCGLTLFDADWEASYRLARADVIVTVKTGLRRKKALMYPTCAKIGVDPNH
jgi:hypothetical protein